MREMRDKGKLQKQRNAERVSALLHHVLHLYNKHKPKEDLERRKRKVKRQKRRRRRRR